MANEIRRTMKINSKRDARFSLAAVSYDEAKLKAVSALLRKKAEGNDGFYARVVPLARDRLLNQNRWGIFVYPKDGGRNRNWKHHLEHVSNKYYVQAEGIGSWVPKSKLEYGEKQAKVKFKAVPMSDRKMELRQKIGYPKDSILVQGEGLNDRFNMIPHDFPVVWKRGGENLLLTLKSGRDADLDKRAGRQSLYRIYNTRG